MEDELKPKHVETFSEDMAKVMSAPSSGQIRQIIREQTENEEERKQFSPESSRNKKFIIIGLVFLILAFGVLFLFFLKKDTLNILMAPRFTPIIFTDSTDYVAIDDLPREDVVSNIYARMQASKIDEGGIEALYLTKNKKIITLRSFMESIRGSLNLSHNNIIKDNFLIGVVNRSEISPFILIQVNSFAEAIEPIITWEDKIFSDLHGFFGVDINPDTGYLLTKDFEDSIVQNKNTRILYDKDQKPVLMVVFIDDNSILITNTEQSVKEMILRLVGSKVKK